MLEIVDKVLPVDSVDSVCPVVLQVEVSVELWVEIVDKVDTELCVDSDV